MSHTEVHMIILSLDWLADWPMRRHPAFKLCRIVNKIRRSRSWPSYQKKIYLCLDICTLPCDVMYSMAEGVSTMPAGAGESRVVEFIIYYRHLEFIVDVAGWKWGLSEFIVAWLSESDCVVNLPVVNTVRRCAEPASKCWLSYRQSVLRYSQFIVERFKMIYSITQDIA